MLAFILAPIIWMAGLTIYSLAEAGTYGLDDPEGRLLFGMISVFSLPGVIVTILAMQFPHRDLADLPTALILGLGASGGAVISALMFAPLWVMVVGGEFFSNIVVFPASLGAVTAIVSLFFRRFDYSRAQPDG